LIREHADAKARRTKRIEGAFCTLDWCNAFRIAVIRYVYDNGPVAVD
jgi:hypothetical protein